MKKLILITLILILGWYEASSQYFQTGQDPASIRWRQLHTRNFQLIYPDYYEVQAQQLAGKLELVYPYGTYSLQHHPNKFPVVLHTQTIQSNGLVAWAPRRAEFYTTPHQAIYPQEWLEQLALHEFRHMVQIDNVDSQLPRWFRAILGQQAAALVFGAYLPWWLIEGDAVVMETALSRYGRGRLPSFLMEHQAQVVEKGVYSYDKAYLGSYRDFVPNHYKLGYLLTGNLRLAHGTSLWEEVFRNTGKKPFSLRPVQSVLKQKTGRNLRENYEVVFDSLKKVWLQEDESYLPQEHRRIGRPQRFYTDYRYSGWLNDRSVIALKSGMQTTPAFYRVDTTGREHKILVPGPIFDESARVQGEWIVWSEYISDLRWQHSGSSLIRALHVPRGDKYRIRSDFKAFSPALSPDRQRVAVVETDHMNRHYLSVYSFPGGSLLHRVQVGGNRFLFSPEWIDKQRIAVIVLMDDGKRLYMVDPDDGRAVELYDGEGADLKQLRAGGAWLYFIGSYTGKNALYRIHLERQTVELVYEPRFGVDSPALSADGNRVIISDYTASGYRLIEIPASMTDPVSIDDTEPGRYVLAEALAAQEPGVISFSDTTTGNYFSEAYRKLPHHFRFHSWAPVYVDTRAYQVLPGVSLMSQNTLGTTETTLGYQWDPAEKRGHFEVRHSFRGWYPMIDVNFFYAPRNSQYYEIESTVNNQGEVISRDTTIRRFSWGHTQGDVTVWLPLILNRGQYRTLLQTEFQYGLIHYQRYKTTPQSFTTGSFHSLGTRIYLQHIRQQSMQDVYPDVGVILDGAYRMSPGGSLKAGDRKAIQSTLYLPGIMKNHGIKMYGGIQHRDGNGDLGFNDLVRYARGWSRINTTGLKTAGIDYKLPLLYPDRNLGGLLYVRRLNLALFADRSWLKGNLYSQGSPVSKFTHEIESYGTEITADVQFMRFYAPAVVGFRSSYLPQKQGFYLDLLLSINFNSF